MKCGASTEIHNHHLILRKVFVVYSESKNCVKIHREIFSVCKESQTCYPRGEEESYLTVFPVKFTCTVQLQRELISLT